MNLEECQMKSFGKNESSTSSHLQILYHQTSVAKSRKQVCSRRNFTMSLNTVVNRARAFRVGSSSGQALGWLLKICRASIGPDAGAKSRFLVSHNVIAIAGMTQREHLVYLFCLSSKYKVLRILYRAYWLISFS